MTEDNVHGKVWRDDELDAIIADYFSMLNDDLASRPYVKSHHAAVLMAQLGRSHKSVEFKHQNISAVLEKLGLPWIPGYIPKANIQSAIFGGIERYLMGHPEALDPLPAQPPGGLVEEVFVAGPKPAASPEKLPLPLVRLVKKFDPVERDHRNRALGKAGEAFVVDIERARLSKLDRDDLARRVRWVAAEDGDGAGYDVLSFEPNGREFLIEVKTTNGAAKTPFYLSRNECELAGERPSDWRIYRVHLFAKTPRIFTITPPLASSLSLRPETWRASF